MKTLYLILIIVASMAVTAQNVNLYNIPAEVSREYFPIDGDVNEYGVSMINVSVHPEIGPYFTKQVTYSIQAWPSSNIPFSPLPQGQTYKIKFLIPPGCAGASVSAESNQWQSISIDTYTHVGTFEYDPGDNYSHTERPEVGGEPDYSDPAIYKSDLHPASGGWNDQILGNAIPIGTPQITEPTYMYAIVHFPQGNTQSSSFQFASFTYSYFVTDYDLYEKWVLSQPWGAGK
jgi:hypothetical protein